MIDLGRFNILGIRMNAVDYEAAVETIVRAAREKRPCAVSALAVHGLMTGALDATHRFRLNQFELLVPDGQPVRWALRWLHNVRLADRVYGPNLMLKTCERAAAERLPIYLYGATDEMLAALRRNLTDRFPLLVIAGMRASRFRRLTPEELDEVVRAIQSSGAAITCVGLGCPRQEVWAYELRESLSMPLLAVGAAFAFHGGTLSQAPEYLQKRGLEWLYRLIREPRRLWKRYLLLNPLYLALVLAQRLGIRRFDPEASTAPRQPMLYG